MPISLILRKQPFQILLAKFKKNKLKAFSEPAKIGRGFNDIVDFEGVYDPLNLANGLGSLLHQNCANVGGPGRADKGKYGNPHYQQNDMGYDPQQQYGDEQDYPGCGQPDQYS